MEEAFGVDGTVLLGVVCVAIAAIVGGVIFFVNQLKKEAGPQGRQRPVPRVRDDGTAVPAAAAARRRGGRGGRDRMRIQRDMDSEEEDNDIPGEEFDDDGETRKIGAKKARKLEMKEEKRQQRQAELEEREERKKRQELIDEQRRKEDEREKQEEAEREAEEQKQKEEEEKKAHEEYLKLKEAFTVEEEGHEQVLTEQESQSLLQEFVDYIKQMKVVVLEDLGAQFNIRTQEAIKRVQELQEQGRLTGVIDDRGKFIYISQDELDAVAKFIRQRGRVSIAELAEASNTLITLNPENQETYQKKLLGETEA